MQVHPAGHKGRKVQEEAISSISGVWLVDEKNGGTSGGYVLDISHENGIRITGNDAAGVFYGIQTLIQTPQNVIIELENWIENHKSTIN